MGEYVEFNKMENYIHVLWRLCETCLLTMQCVQAILSDKDYNKMMTLQGLQRLEKYLNLMGFLEN